MATRAESARIFRRRTRSALRYEIVGRTAAALELLCSKSVTTLRWRGRRVRYVLAGELIEPEIADVVKQAQIRAFCRSFLDRFPA